MLKIKPKENCSWDIVSLGEVMLRLDPGDRRIHTTRSFDVWEGGGEYNVARGLKRCFGLEAAVVTGLADNPVGRLVQDLIYQGAWPGALPSRFNRMARSCPAAAAGQAACWQDLIRMEHLILP